MGKPSFQSKLRLQSSSSFFSFFHIHFLGVLIDFGRNG